MATLEHAIAVAAFGSAGQLVRWRTEGVPAEAAIAAGAVNGGVQWASLPGNAARIPLAGISGRVLARRRNHGGAAAPRET